LKDNDYIIKTMFITQKHKSIEKLFDNNFWENLLYGGALMKSGVARQAARPRIDVATVRPSAAVY